MGKTISVIIPVYNVEKYLPTCMDSLLAQSYKDLEIILIDDGSPDDSGRLCDEYAARDARIRVIHQINGGAANAKNAGLRIATGYYLTFLDSDDYIETDAYEHMVSVLEECDADVLQCAYRDVFVGRKEDQYVLNERREFSVENYLERYTTDWTCGLLWDKLYKRVLFDGIFFEEGHVVDDEFFTYQGIMNAQKVVYDPHIIYNYRKRKSSATGNVNYQERTIGDRLDYLQQRRRKIAERYPTLKKKFDEHYMNMCLWLSVHPYISKELLHRIRTLVKEYVKAPDTGYIPFHQRVQLWKLCHTSIDKLMERKRAPEDIISPDEYYE